MTKKERLEKLFNEFATKEEKLAYELKKKKGTISALAKSNVETKQAKDNLEQTLVSEIESVKGMVGTILERPEPEEMPEITGEEIVEKINELELIEPKKIDFTHIRNFPWDEIKRMGGNDGGFTGYGAYDLNIKAITLGQITANQNDYETGLGGWFRISSDAARTITCFAGGTDGRGFVLTNVGRFNITLANQSASSAAAYRILTGTGNDIILAPDDDAWLIYDITTERWRVLMAGDITGDVLGPASSTDNAIVRFDGTTGKLIQDYTSNAPTISDTGVVTLQGGLLFTDNTYDIGASGATRPRTGYFGTSLVVPTIIGGSATTSDLTLQTTSGVGASGADMHFLVGNNGATEAMTILNSGNVGIGTTAPTSLFHLSGINPSITLEQSGGSTANWILFKGATNAYVGQANGTNGIITGSVAGDLTLRTATRNILMSVDGGASSAMYINSTGNVGIGTAAPNIRSE